VENQRPVYYVEKADETVQTSDRFELAKIKAEWDRNGWEYVEITVDPDTAQEVTK
jgi:hypothetical protein